MINNILSFFRKIMVFIFMTPFLKKVRTRHPKLYSFLATRFSLRKFRGMPLTLLLIATAGNLLMILDIYQDILNAKEFVVIDNLIAEFLFHARTDLLAKFFYAITQLGNQYVILAGAILLSLASVANKKNYNILGLLVAVIGSGLTVQLGKNIFKINRPVHFSYYPMDSFSFPSGHATAAVAFYGFVFYLLIRRARRRNQKFALLVSGIVLILALGFSRLYLCEHFLSDVLGGYLLGFLWLMLSISIHLWIEDRMKP